eukprot:1079573-Pelagomonas_calceolata.AAC.6
MTGKFIASDTPSRGYQPLSFDVQWIEPIQAEIEPKLPATDSITVDAHKQVHSWPEGTVRRPAAPCTSNIPRESRTTAMAEVDGVRVLVCWSTCAYVCKGTQQMVAQMQHYCCLTWESLYLRHMHCILCTCQT